MAYQGFYFKVVCYDNYKRKTTAYNRHVLILLTIHFKSHIARHIPQGDILASDQCMVTIPTYVVEPGRDLMLLITTS